MASVSSRAPASVGRARSGAGDDCPGSGPQNYQQRSQAEFAYPPARTIDVERLGGLCAVPAQNAPAPKSTDHLAREHLLREVCPSVAIRGGRDGRGGQLFLRSAQRVNPALRPAGRGDSHRLFAGGWKGNAALDWAGGELGTRHAPGELRQLPMAHDY